MPVTVIPAPAGVSDFATFLQAYLGAKQRKKEEALEQSGRLFDFVTETAGKDPAAQEAAIRFFEDFAARNPEGVKKLFGTTELPGTQQQVTGVRGAPSLQGPSTTDVQGRKVFRATPTTAEQQQKASLEATQVGTESTRLSMEMAKESREWNRRNEMEKQGLKGSEIAMGWVDAQTGKPVDIGRANAIARTGAGWDTIIPKTEVRKKIDEIKEITGESTDYAVNYMRDELEYTREKNELGLEGLQLDLDYKRWLMEGKPVAGAGGMGAPDTEQSNAMRQALQNFHESAVKGERALGQFAQYLPNGPTLLQRLIGTVVAPVQTATGLYNRVFGEGVEGPAPLSVEGAATAFARTGGPIDTAAIEKFLAAEGFPEKGIKASIPAAPGTTAESGKGEPTGQFIKRVYTRQELAADIAGALTEFDNAKSALQVLSAIHPQGQAIAAEKVGKYPVLAAMLGETATQTGTQGPAQGQRSWVEEALGQLMQQLNAISGAESALESR